MKKNTCLVLITSILFLGCKKEVTSSTQTTSATNNTNVDLPNADFTFDGKNYSITSSTISTGGTSTDIPVCYSNNYTPFIFNPTMTDAKYNFSIEVDVPKKAGDYTLSNMDCDGYLTFRIKSNSSQKEYSNHVLFHSELSNGKINYDGNQKIVFEANVYDTDNVENDQIDKTPHILKGTMYIPSKLASQLK